MHQKNESIPQDIIAIPKAKICFQIKGMSETLEKKINLLLKENKFQETYSLLLENLNACLADGEMLIKLGHLCFRLGKYDDAEYWYFKALNEENGERFPSLWFGLGQLYYKVRNSIKCISSFLHLLSSYPNFEFSSLAYMKIGISYQLTKNYEESIPYLQKSLEKQDLTPDLYSEALCHLGINFLYSDPNKGFQYFDQAASLCKNFRTATCLAWKLICTEPRKSVFLCENMLKECSVSESFDYKFFMAIAFFKLKVIKKALRLLEEICSQNMNHLLFGKYLVWVYVQTQQHEKAIAILNKLCSYWCFKADLLIKKYMIALKIGKTNEAMESYTKAFEILTLQGLSGGYINNMMLTTINQGIDEPKFSLADCPLVQCNEYININSFC